MCNPTRARSGNRRLTLRPQISCCSRPNLGGAFRCVTRDDRHAGGRDRRATAPASSLVDHGDSPPSSRRSTPTTPTRSPAALARGRLSRRRRRRAGGVRAGGRALAQGLALRRSARLDPARRDQPRPQPPALTQAPGGAAAAHRRRRPRGPAARRRRARRRSRRRWSRRCPNSNASRSRSSISPTSRSPRSPTRWSSARAP